MLSTSARKRSNKALDRSARSARSDTVTFSPRTRSMRADYEVQGLQVTVATVFYHFSRLHRFVVWAACSAAARFAARSSLILRFLRL